MFYNYVMHKKGVSSPRFACRSITSTHQVIDGLVCKIIIHPLINKATSYLILRACRMRSEHHYDMASKEENLFKQYHFFSVGKISGLERIKIRTRSQPSSI
jgi:hypothetical protein